MAEGVGLELYIPRQDLLKIGLAGAVLIRTRTQKGIDAKGNSFGGYGTKPFARPYDGITAKAAAMLGDQLQVFTTQQGQLWAIIIGGYAAFKRAAYAQDADTVNLTVTGRMLGSLAVVGTNEATGEVRLGFLDQESAEKAYYLSEAGAGPSRRTFDFMGFTDAEIQRLTEMAVQGVRIRV